MVGPRKIEMIKQKTKGQRYLPLQKTITKKWHDYQSKYVSLNFFSIHVVTSLALTI